MRIGRSISGAVATGLLAAAFLAPATSTAATAPASKAATPSATVQPAPVHDVAAFDTAHGVRVTWTNPTTPFAGVTVRYAKGGTAPADPSSGGSVDLSSPTAHSARLPDLLPGTRYSVALWTYDAANDYSRRSLIRFTTLPAPEADATVSGTVTDSKGHPLANVHVYSETFSATEHGGTTTDAAGHYALTLRPDSYYLGFDGALATGGNSDRTGYQSDFAQLARLHAGEIRAGVDAVLAPGAAITGRVADAAGHPLAGVVPTAQPVGPYVETTTNSAYVFLAFFGSTDANPSAADGTFAIKGLPPATVRVCLDPTAGPATGGSADAVGYVGRCATRSITVGVGHVLDAGDTSLDTNPGGVIAGLVTDASGSPVAGVFVAAESGGHSQGGYGFTRADGTYRIEVDPGRFRVCADPGYVDRGGANSLATCTPALGIAAGEVRTVDVQMRPAGGLAGRVTGPGGGPVAGADVEIRKAGHPYSYFGSATTDGHGGYQVDGLPAGDYVACVQPASRPSARYPTGVTPGCLNRRSPQPVRIGAVSLGLDGRLGLGGAVSGHVLDESGVPTSEAFVDVYRSRSPGFFDVEAEVAPDGSYTAAGLPTGNYTVCATWVPPFDGSGELYFSSLLAGCRSPSAAVTAGTTTTGIDPSVATGGSVTVSVHDSHGRPLGGVDVAALSRCPRNGYCTRIPLFDPQLQVSVEGSQVTSADGIAHLHGLPPGQYAICLFAYYGSTFRGSSDTGYSDSCNGHTFDVQVDDHQTTVVDRQLAAGGAVSGTVTDTTGQPLAGVRLIVSGGSTSDYLDPSDPLFFGGPAEEAVTDAAGHFTVPGVTPGDQTVCVDASGAVGGSSRTGYLDACVGGSNPRTATPVPVAARKVTNVELALPTAAAISGRITAADGRVPRYAAALILRSLRRGYFVDVDGAGRYRVDRLPPGTYRVCFVSVRYHAQCYAGVPWNDGGPVPRAATRIVLAAGQERRHVDAVLRR
jgi:protocatechuate 3,4-dioxygenase beta subunit